MPSPPPFYKKIILLNVKKCRIEVNCKVCGKIFEKTKSQFNKSELKSGNHYCSRSCCGKDSISKKMGGWFGFKKIDEYTGFREYIRRAKNRNKLGNLTVEDLKIIWEKQNGICPYTGIKLKLTKTKNNYEFELASLDRIDSSKLYNKDNVIFVSTPINFMKNSMTQEKAIEFCKIITNFWKDKI